jgi:hypothetical protein
MLLSHLDGEGYSQHNTHVRGMAWRNFHDATGAWKPEAIVRLAAPCRYHTPYELRKSRPVA